MKELTCERGVERIDQTVGSWLAGLALSAVIVGICGLGHKTGCCRCRYEASEDTTNTVYRTGGSSMLQYMINPVHSWHPVNINHIHHR